MGRMTILSPTGSVGLGFSEQSFKAALERSPDVIACDAGSTDLGAYFLGTGQANASREATKRDLGLMISAGRELDIPVIVGSAGFAGGAAGVSWMREVVEEICDASGVQLDVALVHAEQDKSRVSDWLRRGRLAPLPPREDPATPAEIEACEHIVGVMGAEPIQRALATGAHLIIAGRATDAALFAALPLSHGLPTGAAWHAAKLLESGAACAEPAAMDCLLVTIDDDGFVVESTSQERVCTTRSVAAHFLYENPGLQLMEPTGILDVADSVYEALPDGVVRVTGSTFVSSRLTVKLEAAQIAGYRAIAIGGVRDPVLLGQVPSFLDDIRANLARRVDDTFGGAMTSNDYAFTARAYGLNGVMGALEPNQVVTGHEAALIFDVVAKDQAKAISIVKMAVAAALHANFPGKLTINAGNLAFPYSPNTVPMGPVYTFGLNQLVLDPDEEEMFPVELIEVGANTSAIASGHGR